MVGAGVGFFLNYQTTRMTRKVEQKKAIKEHLKEFSNLALQVSASLDSLVLRLKEHKKRILHTLPSEFRGSVIALRWIV